MLERGQIISGRFRLEDQLGEGGMGAVWRAYDERLAAWCAIKVIHSEMAAHSALVARFECEAHAAAQLRSAHIVQILDVGLTDGRPYMAMELLEGEDLGQRIRRSGHLTAASTCMIVSQIARALTRAHQVGIVHRDLKPENIFLVSDDDRDLVKVLDFGIAKHPFAKSDRHATFPGVLLGTPHYMSPEQASSSDSVDARSDLWSLAIVAFECLTGRLPFADDTLASILNQILSGSFEPLTHYDQTLPPAVDAWWQRATQRAGALRFQTAKELSSELTKALGLKFSSISPRFSRLPPKSATVAPRATATDSGLAHTVSEARAPSKPKRRWVPVALVGASIFVAAGFGWAGLGARPSSRHAESSAPGAAGSPAPTASAPLAVADAPPASAIDERPVDPLEPAAAAPPASPPETAPRQPPAPSSGAKRPRPVSIPPASRRAPGEWVRVTPWKHPAH